MITYCILWTQRVDGEYSFFAIAEEVEAMHNFISWNTKRKEKIKRLTNKNLHQVINNPTRTR